MSPVLALIGQKLAIVCSLQIGFRDFKENDSFFKVSSILVFHTYCRILNLLILKKFIRHYARKHLSIRGSKYAWHFGHDGYQVCLTYRWQQGLDMLAMLITKGTKHACHISFVSVRLFISHHFNQSGFTGSERALQEIHFQFWKYGKHS